MFKNYTQEQYKDLKNIHNVLVLVGNGFDISVINNYQNIKFPNRTTSFADYYDYISFYRHVKTTNLIFKKMKINKNKGKENWSDFELTIQDMLVDGTINIKDLRNDLYEIRKAFVYYLNDLISPYLMIEVNNAAQYNKWATITMGKFLKDLPMNCGIRFSTIIDHYDLINYQFVNFNYTSLLDNYIYLDSKQFDPHKHVVADRNFEFYCNQNMYNMGEWTPSVYLMSDIIHPNGYQSIPRSLIFGANEELIDVTHEKKFLNKPYVGQYSKKYFDYFSNTKLFIIFGMSLGITDGWWFNNILDALIADSNKELIIYYYDPEGKHNEDEIKKIFYDSCCLYKGNISDISLLNTINKQIYIVLHKDNLTNFLGLKLKSTVEQ